MSGQFLHQNLARGRWFELSLVQQLGNIGSEVGRARRSCDKDEAKFWGAAARAGFVLSDFIRQALERVAQKGNLPRLRNFLRRAFGRTNLWRRFGIA